MRSPLPARRPVGGASRALLAMLLVFARLLGPAMAAPHTGAALAEFDRAARASICHAAPADAGAPAGKAPARHGACLICPACHGIAAVALPAPDGPGLPAPATVSVRPFAPPPPATGPPSRKREAAPPTGPPSPSA